MTKFELNILGCGSATSSLRHLPSCQVLNIRDNLFLIDCGEGAQLEMRRYRLKFSRLSHIFISHLHGDHCFGLPGLLSTLALLDKTSSVTIHIFREGAEQFQHMLDFFCRNMPYEVKFNIIETKSGIIYEDDAITVTTFPLNHSVPTVGFLFAEKPKLRHIDPYAVKKYEVPLHYMNNLRQGKDYITHEGSVIPNCELTTDADPSLSYAYCSDTTYSSHVVEAIKGADWLYHEATYGEEYTKEAHHRLHSTTADAARVALEAGVKRLIIGHFSSRYTDEMPLLSQSQAIFPDTQLAKEGLCIDLNKL